MEKYGENLRSVSVLCGLPSDKEIDEVPPSTHSDDVISADIVSVF